MAQQFRAVPVQPPAPRGNVIGPSVSLPLAGGINNWARDLKTKARSEYKESDMNNMIKNLSKDQLGVEIFWTAAQAVGKYVDKHTLFIRNLKMASHGNAFTHYASDSGAPMFYDYNSAWHEHYSELRQAKVPNVPGAAPPPAPPNGIQPAVVLPTQAAGGPAANDYYPYLLSPNFTQANSLLPNPNLNEANAHNPEFYELNDILFPPNTRPVRGRWLTQLVDGRKRQRLTDSQEPDGAFEILFEADDMTFYVMVECDADKKAIGTSTAQNMEDNCWAHAKKLVQSIDINNTKDGHHHNDAFLVRINLSWGRIDDAVAAAPGSSTQLRFAKQFIAYLEQIYYASVDVWVQILKNITVRLRKPSVPRTSFTYWINYCTPGRNATRMNISMKSWKRVLRDTNQAAPDNVFRTTTFFGALREKHMRTSVRTIPLDADPRLPHARKLATIHVSKIKLPSENDITMARNYNLNNSIVSTANATVLNQRAAVYAQAREKARRHKHLLWCVPDLYKLVDGKTNEDVNWQFINWITNPPYANIEIIPTDVNTALDPAPDVQEINRNFRYNTSWNQRQHEYFDFPIFRFLEFVIHMQQYQLGEIWKHFEYKPLGRGTRGTFFDVKDAHDTYNRIVTRTPDALVNRANIRINPLEYPDNLPFKAHSRNLSAVLFRSANKTMPALDPNLLAYINRYNMVGAAVLLRAMRCTNLAVLQETARQYRQGDESLRKKIEGLLKQFPVCSESELRWLFHHVLAHPVTLV